MGSFAINTPPVCSQSSPTHPVKSAFCTILLRFSWDIGICSLTTPLTAEIGRMICIIRPISARAPRRASGECRRPNPQPHASEQLEPPTTKGYPKSETASATSYMTILAKPVVHQKPSTASSGPHYLHYS